MNQGRRCLACGVNLAGPFLPRMDLVPPAGEPDDEAQVVAYAWACPECGLVHWYAAEPEPDEQEDAPGEVVGRPGPSYERRSEIARMLRRVRRM